MIADARHAGGISTTSACCFAGLPVIIRFAEVTRPAQRVWLTETQQPVRSMPGATAQACAVTALQSMRCSVQRDTRDALLTRR